tara:strand:- start:30066 stop:30518 length:453 start_codon:yes stop_codon:yes gene_type:complete
MKQDEFVNRNYRIKMEFNLSGDVPAQFTQDQLKNEIESLLGEIEISSEIFEGEREDYVWALFPNDKIEFDIFRYDYTFVERPSCEHCGDNHCDFGVQIYRHDNGILWCWNCGSQYLSYSERQTIPKKEKKERKKFLKAKIEALKDELKEL